MRKKEEFDYSYFFLFVVDLIGRVGRCLIFRWKFKWGLLYVF